MGGHSLGRLRRLRMHVHTRRRVKSVQRGRLTLHVSALRTYSPSGLFYSRVRTLIRRTVDRLPPADERIFVLDQVGGLPGGRVTLQLSVSMGAMRFRVAQSLGRLQIRLGSCRFL